MRRLVLLAAVLSMAASCPQPPQPPQPPAQCPESCPLGSECKDPALGCQPIPAPGPVCQEGQNYGCWHWPPDSTTWLYACPVYNSAGQVVGVVNVVGGPAQCPGTPEPPQPPEPPTPPEPPVPPNTVCPKDLAPGAVVYLNDKSYGQGFDATVRVKGDPAFCQKIHGVAKDDCHLEGWPKRVECEMALIGGCPIWQFSLDADSSQPCVDDQYAKASCDHFGSVEYRDDPKTPEFEGQPKQCGLQRDEHGPIAGFFTIAHGKAYVRACRPDGKACGPWRPFDH